MERIVIELSVEGDRALRVLHMIRDGLDEVERSGHRAGAAIDGLANKTEGLRTAGTRAGEAAKGFKDAGAEAKKAADGIAAMNRPAFEAGTSIGYAATSTGQWAISLRTLLEIVQRFEQFAQQKIRSANEAALPAGQRRLAERESIKPLLENYKFSGPLGEQTALQMAASVSMSTGLQHQQAVTLLGVAANSQKYWNTPRDREHITQIGRFIARSGLTDGKEIEQVLSVLAGPSGKLDQNAIDFMAKLEEASRHSGIEGMGRFVAGFAAGAAGPINQGVDRDGILAEFTAMTKVMPRGQQPALLLKHQYTQAQGMEEGTKKYLAGEAIRRGLLNVSPATAADADAALAEGKLPEAQRLQSNIARLDEMRRDQELDRTRPAGRGSDPRRRQLTLDQQGRKIAELESKIAADRVKLQEAITAERGVKGLAGLSLSQLKALQDTLAREALEDPAARSRFIEGQSGNSARMAAILLGQGDAARRYEAQAAAAIAGPDVLKQFQFRQGEFTRQGPFQKNEWEARARLRRLQSTTAGTSGADAFLAFADDAWRDFKENDPRYQNKMFDFGAALPFGTPMGTKPLALTEESMEAAFKSQLLLEQARKKFNELPPDEQAAQFQAFQDLEKDLINRGTIAEALVGKGSRQLNKFINSTKLIFQKLDGAAARQSDREAKQLGITPNIMPTAEPSITTPPAIPELEGLPMPEDLPGVPELGPVGMNRGGGIGYQINVGQLFVAPGGMRQLPGRLDYLG